MASSSQVDHHGLVLDGTLGISAFCSQEAPFSLEASAQSSSSDSVCAGGIRRHRMRRWSRNQEGLGA